MASGTIPKLAQDVLFPRDAVWKDFPDGLHGAYYENSHGTINLSTYDLPSYYCFMLVMKNGTRGVAVAIDWRNDKKLVWINRLQGTWAGWYQLQAV